MNKAVYLELSILELSKMYKFWYNYIKPEYDKKQSCIMWIQIASLYT